MKFADLLGALENRNVQAFLRVIRAGEGTADEDGYRRIFGGELFDGFEDHPRRLVRKSGYSSTAAGAYQFLSRTWDALVRQYGFGDFTPHNQDLAAVALIAGRRALDDVLAGRIEQAIAKCAREWASLPGSPYGQPTRTLKQAMSTYAQYGGYEAALGGFALEHHPEPSSPQKESAMPPFLLAAIPALIEAIPKLAQLFGSGSEVQQRNIAAAETVAKIVQEATGSKNIQEAVETIKAQPEMAQAAKLAVEANWFALTEAGGGGIDGARKADREFMASGRRVWDSPSFWALLLLLPLVYLIVGAMVGLYGSLALSAEVTASIITGIVTLVIGGAAGYYWGSATSANRPQPVDRA